VLNPLEPQLEPFDWALAWAGLLPDWQLSALLESAFFPGWHAILRTWLSAQPDYDEVTRWFMEWKARFPQGLLDQPRVRAAFAHGLNMMNCAADGKPLPAPRGAGAAAGGVDGAGGSMPAWRREMEQPAAAAGMQPQQHQQRPPSAAAAAASAAEPSLRELVARYAQEAGLEFLPRAGRLHDGLPVYAFGGVSCVVDGLRHVVRAQLRERGWVPVSLEKLKAEALAKAPRGNGGG
jgi:tuftelin-interacting protein 11